MFVLHLGEKKSEVDDEVEAFSIQIRCRFSVSICGKSLLPLPPTRTVKFTPSPHRLKRSDNEGQQGEVSNANWSNRSTTQVAEYQIIHAPQPTASTWKEEKQKPPFVSQGFAGIKTQLPFVANPDSHQEQGAASKLPRLSSGNGLF